MASKEELLKQLSDGVVEYDEEVVKNAAQSFLDNGHDPLEGIMDGLAAGMVIVGDLYERNEYFVPEVLMCADALYAGLDILRPHVPADSGSIKGQVVIGTVGGCTRYRQEPGKDDVRCGRIYSARFGPRRAA